MERIIQEAKTCYVDDGQLYTYHIAGDDGVALQFNSIYQVVAAKFDGHNYRSVGELTPFEKVCNNVLELITVFFSETLNVISPFLFFFIELVIWKRDPCQIGISDLYHCCFCTSISQTFL